MARTALTPALVAGLDGAELPAAAAGDDAEGNVVHGNDGRSLLVRVTNTSGDNPYSVTFVTPGKHAGYELADHVVEVAAQEELWFGPFPLAAFSHELQIDVESSDLELLAVKVG